jgi:Oxygen-sensitive ribonucleoside-triphosphate reductase
LSVPFEELKRAIKEVLHEEFPEESSEEETSKKIIDHVTDCPECYKGVFEKLNKTSDYKCKDCGLPLGNKELAEKIKNCPLCGSEDAEEIEKE